ncbi:MAG: SiaB family protein kinase [Candidatus Electrothrix scaldis]|nr:MAG: SiaB family protein kinase [Candidatus Electrothrix sp. GW3-3]
MDSFDVFGFYQYMEKHDVIISFKGKISQKLLISIGDVLKEKLSHKETSQKVVRKVFFIFIELGQNIYQHSFERDFIQENQIAIGVLFIRECEEYFTVFAGNIVTPEEAEEIKEQCATINELNKDELKRHYKTKIKQDRADGKVGAGVGLISIVRKAEKPINVSTTPIDEAKTFLVLSVKIDKE